MELASLAAAALAALNCCHIQRGRPESSLRGPAARLLQSLQKKNRRHYSNIIVLLLLLLYYVRSRRCTDRVVILLLLQQQLSLVVLPLLELPGLEVLSQGDRCSFELRLDLSGLRVAHVFMVACAGDPQSQRSFPAALQLGLSNAFSEPRNLCDAGELSRLSGAVLESPVLPQQQEEHQRQHQLLQQ